MQDVLFIGLDLGTQGVRAMLADTEGRVLASSSCRYARINAAEGEGKEQAAYDWEKTAWQVLAGLTRQAQERLRDAQVFLAVDDKIFLFRANHGDHPFGGGVAQQPQQAQSFAV